jgi:hypothetical protein
MIRTQLRYHVPNTGTRRFFQPAEKYLDEGAHKKKPGEHPGLSVLPSRKKHIAGSF